jgi:hypothetical protein
MARDQNKKKNSSIFSSFSILSIFFFYLSSSTNLPSISLPPTQSPSSLENLDLSKNNLSGKISSGFVHDEEFKHSIS